MNTLRPGPFCSIAACAATHAVPERTPSPRSAVAVPLSLRSRDGASDSTRVRGIHCGTGLS